MITQTLQCAHCLHSVLSLSSPFYFTTTTHVVNNSGGGQANEAGWSVGRSVVVVVVRIRIVDLAKLYLSLSLSLSLSTTPSDTETVSRNQALSEVNTARHTEHTTLHTTPQISCLAMYV